MIGKGDGTFEYMPNREHGLKLDGDISDLHILEIKGQRMLQVIRNNEAEIFLEILNSIMVSAI